MHVTRLNHVSRVTIQFELSHVWTTSNMIERLKLQNKWVTTSTSDTTRVKSSHSCHCGWKMRFKIIFISSDKKNYTFNFWLEKRVPLPPQATIWLDYFTHNIVTISTKLLCDSNRKKLKVHINIYSFFFFFQSRSS